VAAGLAIARPRRTVVWVAVLVILTAYIGWAPAVSPARADGPGITLAKHGPGSVLAGDQAEYTLTATNPAQAGAVPEYNLSFSDVLPLGATYVPNSTTPTSFPEPAVTTDPGSGRVVLVWSSVSDLVVGETVTLGYRVDLGGPGDVVGSTVSDDASAAVNSDPRTIPGFDPDGQPKAGSYTESAAASAATTASALEIRKSEPSPEHELLRGVHDQRTTYTLRVKNTSIDPTDDVTVTDYLPAGLEFLGCGDSDNTQPGTEVEYTDAPRLGVPPMSFSDCLTPDSVDTVLDPPPNGSQTYPPGVYTKVTWTLGDLAAGSETTIRYAAGIPLHRNTMSWSGAVPSPGSLDQGSNLNNNDGLSTREDGTEVDLTNYARATGTYQGPTVGPAAVEATTTQTVTIEDLRMRKSVSPPVFDSSGGNDIATYSMIVDNSEYVSASGIVITDTVPDGLCPLGMGVAECGGGGAAPSHAVNSVTHNGDGTYSVVFEPWSLPHNGTATVTFDARMMPAYSGGAHAGEPTAAGDSFTNRATLAAVTTPIPGTDESGPADVTDSAQATQTTASPSAEKTMKPRPIGDPPNHPDPNDSCTQDLGDYGTPPFPAPDSAAKSTFHKGDRVCFKLRVDFPDSVRTRNAVVGDFVPRGTELIDPPAYVATGNSTVPVASFSPGGAGLPATWTLGTPSGGALYVDEGAVFEVTIAVRVLDPAPPPEPDVAGNLMKTRWENTDGVPHSDRELIDFDVAPAANVTLTKGVVPGRRAGIGTVPAEPGRQGGP
jgi:large repetitive protein